MVRDAPLIFLIAGEPSGDLIASRLMAALRRRAQSGVRFAGVGGPLMAEQGLESLFPYDELSLMGILEIVPHVPRMLRRIRATARTARRLRPAACVSVDVPEFALRVARRLKGAGFPLIHYVAPTVWAYRPGRAAKIARYLDHVLCLFPFEPPYFEAEGLDASFVGHPLVEEPIADADGPSFRDRHGIAPAQPAIAVLPGSRASELRRHEHAFGETVRTLVTSIEGLRVLVPTLPQNRATVAAQTVSWGAPVTVIEGKAEKYGAFAASDAAPTPLPQPSRGASSRCRTSRCPTSSPSAAPRRSSCSRTAPRSVSCPRWSSCCGMPTAAATRSRVSGRSPSSSAAAGRRPASARPRSSCG